MKQKKKGRLKCIVIIIIALIIILYAIGASEDSGTTQDETKRESGIAEENEISVDSGDVSEESQKQTPKECIFSGDKDNYPIYVYKKDTELITVHRDIFMDEPTEDVDVAFNSAVGDDSGNMELDVRKPSFDNDEYSLLIHDWEYDNLNEPIIITFASDMSYIDVSATWNEKITNEQSLYNGHYELEGIYNTDEYVSKFYTEDGFSVPSAESEENDNSFPEGMKIDNETIEYFDLSGKYVGDNLSSEIELNIYSSPEQDIIGNVQIASESTEYNYSGEVSEVEKNVYCLENVEDEVLLSVYRNDDGILMIELYVNGEYVDQYTMQEHYES